MVFLYETIIKSTVSISLLLAILIILKYHRLNSLLKVVGIYIIVGASIDLVSTALYFKQQNNLKFLHLFTLFEFVLLSYLFYRLFKIYKSKFNLIYLSGLATAFIVGNTLIIQDIGSLNSYSSVLSSVLIISFCIHYFILILDKEEVDYQHTVLKWAVISLFIYHCTSLIVMFFGGVIFDISSEAVRAIWSFRILIILGTKVMLSYFFVKLLFFKDKIKPQ